MNKKQQGQREGGRMSQNTLEREIFVTSLPPVLNEQAATVLTTPLIGYRCLFPRLV